MSSDASPPPQCNTTAPEQPFVEPKKCIHCACCVFLGRLNEEYEREQDRQEKKRQDDVKAREAKSRRAYEVGDHNLISAANRCTLHQCIADIDVSYLVIVTLWMG